MTWCSTAPRRWVLTLHWITSWWAAAVAAVVARLANMAAVAVVQVACCLARHRPCWAAFTRSRWVRAVQVAMARQPQQVWAATVAVRCSTPGLPSVVAVALTIGWVAPLKQVRQVAAVL